MRQEAMRASFPQGGVVGGPSPLGPYPGNPVSMTAMGTVGNDTVGGWSAQMSSANDTLKKMSQLEYLRTKH